jgi:hypothetical protein
MKTLKKILFAFALVIGLTVATSAQDKDRDKKPPPKKDPPVVVVDRGKDKDKPKNDPKNDDRNKDNRKNKP